MSTEAMKLQEIMTQAQVFASAWSLVGGRFDGGNAMDEAEVAKNELYQMVAEALAQPQQDRDYTWPTVADYENDVGFKVNQAFKMAWDMARTTNSFLNLLAKDTPQPAEPQQEPVAWLQIGLAPFHQDDVIARTTKPTEWNRKWWRFEPLYTSPPARKPLTDEQIRNIWDGHIVPVFGKNGINPVVFARLIEAAHNIKEQP